MNTCFDFFENYCKIEKQISQFAPKQNVQIVCATKGQTVETLQHFSEKYFEKYGKKPIFGENKAQEFLTKYGKVDAVWHFIGTLQTNKVKYIIDKVDCIQSVSSEKLLAEIQKQAAKAGRTIDIFLEINIADEQNKTGANEKEFLELLEQTKNCKNVCLSGLMAMLPANTAENNAKFCLQIRSIYDKIKEQYGLKNFSFGMSNDYMQAISHGSNMVRIGRAIFNEQ